MTTFGQMTNDPLAKGPDTGILLTKGCCHHRGAK